MKNTLLVISLTLGLISCDVKPTNDTNSESTTNLITTKEQSLLQELDKRAKSEIVGLWKLYKTTTLTTGETKVEQKNVFLNLKSDNSMEDNRYQGVWYLSFNCDSLNQYNFITIVRTQGYPSIQNFLFQKGIENNTTYLKLENIEDQELSYYIRQQ